MKCILVLSLIFSVGYSTTQFVTRRPPTSPCENSDRNTLVEHFFNVVFTEFYTSPPVCVCVQMCAGHSTYCYPNGCFRSVTAERDDIEETTRTAAAAPLPQVQKNKNQFMLVKDEKNDFMADFIERNYVDDSKSGLQKNPAHDLRPDPFKDKYSILGKYKKSPKVELRYNLHEKVKNAKYDSLKHEGADWLRARWPVNKYDRGGKYKLLTEVEKPLISKANFFAAMLPENEVLGSPPKYFKRDLTKPTNSDDVTVNSIYVLDNSLNATDSKSLSIETLIDSLIKSSFGTNADTATNFAVAKRDEAVIETKEAMETVVSVNSTGLTNETTSVISMNFTNENVDKNKYSDDTFPMNKTNNLNEMITSLAKEIEKQNNTSLEIAKRVIEDFNETTQKKKFNENASTESNPTTNYVENVTTTEITIFTTKPTTLQDIAVTKKNRQRVLRKLVSSKTN